MTLAPHLARLGYCRYWMTEHYSPTQSPAPLVLAAAVAAIPGVAPMRVGTAGVLLSLRSPESIVADASIGAALAPGRFDLGIAGASTGDAVLDDALIDGRDRAVLGAYGDRLARLRALVGERSRDLAVGEDLAPAHLLGPCDIPAPALWLCGTSASSASLAGRLGFAYAFHAGLAGRETCAADVIETYRASWRAHHHDDEAHRAVVATWVRVGTRDPDCEVSGPPDEACDRLLALARRCRVDEVVIAEMADDVGLQAESYRAFSGCVGAVL